MDSRLASVAGGRGELVAVATEGRAVEEGHRKGVGHAGGGAALLRGTGQGVVVQEAKWVVQ